MSAVTDIGTVARPVPRGAVAQFVSRLVREKPVGTAAGLLFVLFVLCGVFANILAPYGFNEIIPIDRLKPPSWKHPFGTDNLGRDMLSRCLYGARLSVIIGLSAALIATVISVVIGTLTGYLGGRFDMVTQRFVDAYMSFPELVILIAVVSVVGPGMVQIICILSLVLGIAGSRIIRSAVVSARENMYVHAAQSIGASETIGDQSFKLPFVDKIIYRTIKDEATFYAALRTSKLDLLESIRWSAVEELKKSAPQLQWLRWLNTGGTFLAMRVDTKPFDDVRVRRALNMAVNKQEIVSSYYGGNAELFAYPQHPDYIGYFEPLEKMPEAARELFVYNPDKAKALLAEAGYPNGFSFKVQVCSCAPDHMDLLPLVSAYLEKVGVKIEIQPMEYGAFLSAMTTKTNAAGYFMQNGHTNPTTTIRKSFVTKQTWNPSQYSDPDYDKKMAAVYREQDESKRQQMLKEMTREIVEKAPYIWLPVAYYYSAWWPWVKNYGGELRAGSERPGPIHARMWIDQDMKKKMGY